MTNGRLVSLSSLILFICFLYKNDSTISFSFRHFDIGVQDGKGEMKNMFKINEYIISRQSNAGIFILRPFSFGVK